MSHQLSAFNHVSGLQARLGVTWPAISRAVENSVAKSAELVQLLAPPDNRAIAEDASIVFFGSLARGEWTSQSDADWVLLVDGQVDEQHFAAFQFIRRKLRESKAIDPGTTATFGDLAFSHELVHRIGGGDDTNRNLTLRMLLLLESISIGDDLARKRVIHAILHRYLADDPSWTWWPDAKLPRFVLNDAVRFWRTMAVDFADKFHDQAGEKWALRNAKLRFSRKLIFLVALLACFRWQIEGPRKPKDSDQGIDIPIQFFESFFSRPPLDLVADELARTGASDQVCTRMFSAYDEFLSILDNEEYRTVLKNLPRELAGKNSLFQRVREIGHSFQGAITDWLFGTPELFDLVKTYGLF